ncbi:formate dehydrogenase [Variovorax paradoxus]|nr:formate dehydrogenase [Variovorax paradoxus]
MQDSQATGTKPASRRGFFIGAASAGAAVAAVSVLPKVTPTTAAVEAAAPAIKPAPEKGGGYSLSEHVKRYYKTASA